MGNDYHFDIDCGEGSLFFPLQEKVCGRSAARRGNGASYSKGLFSHAYRGSSQRDSMAPSTLTLTC